MTRLQIENKIKEYETIKTWYFDNMDKWKAEDYKKKKPTKKSDKKLNKTQEKTTDEQ